MCERTAPMNSSNGYPRGYPLGPSECWWHVLMLKWLSNRCFVYLAPHENVACGPYFVARLKAMLLFAAAVFCLLSPSRGALVRALGGGLSWPSTAGGSFLFFFLVVLAVHAERRRAERRGSAKK